MQIIQGLVKSAAVMCSVALLLLCGCLSQKDAGADSRTLVGILYVTGNEPFTNLALQTEDGKMHVVRRDTTALYSELWKLQGRKLLVWFRLRESKLDSSLISIERYSLVKDQ